MTEVFIEQQNSICTVIPQPFTICDIPQKTCINHSSSILKEIGTHKKFPILTSFGYISEHKRYDIILNTFKKFIARYPQALFIIIGHDNIGLSGIIRESGFEGRVIITDTCQMKFLFVF